MSGLFRGARGFISFISAPRTSIYRRYYTIGANTFRVIGGEYKKKNASIRNQLHSRNTHFYTYQYLNLNHLYWEPDPEACQSKRVLASDRSSKLPIKNFAWDVIIQNGVVFHQFKYRLGKLYAFVCVIFRTCHWI